MKKKNYKVKLKVKELLEERNITQKKLAQISGIRESTIILIGNISLSNA